MDPEFLDPGFVHLVTNARSFTEMFPIYIIAWDLLLQVVILIDYRISSGGVDYSLPCRAGDWNAVKRVICLMRLTLQDCVGNVLFCNINKEESKHF